MREKYEVLAFISKQDAEWKEHQREIGLFGRLYEYIFGSRFAHNQLEEFKEFCRIE